MVTFRIHTLSLVFLAAWIGYTNSQTCESNQQNEEFLGLLKNKPAVAINLVSDYDHTNRVIPEARGLGGTVTTAVFSPTLQFPPVGAKLRFRDTGGMTSSLTISQSDFGNGVTTMSYSSSDSPSSRKPHNLFAPWASGVGTMFQWNPALWNYGTYTGNAFIEPSYKGDWFKFKSPECFTMQKSWFVPRAGGTNLARAPGLFKIYARNLDNDPWIPIFEKNTIDLPDFKNEITDGRCFLQYGLVVNRLYGLTPAANVLNFISWKIEGTYDTGTTKTTGVYDVSVSNGAAIQFPPLDATVLFGSITPNAATMTISNAAVANGAWQLSWSSNWNNQYWPYNIFNPSVDGTGALWHEALYTNGVYIGASSLDGGVYDGDWFSFKAPSCIRLKTSSFIPRDAEYSTIKSPGLYWIYAKNLDADPWIPVYKHLVIVHPTEVISIDIGDVCYSQYALVVSRLYGDGDVLNFRSWILNGIHSPPQLVTTGTAGYNAVNPVTSLYAPVATTWTWPTLPTPTYTRCWTTRNQKENRFPPEIGTFVMSDDDTVKATMTVSDAAYGNGAYELNFSPAYNTMDNRSPARLFRPSTTDTTHTHFDNSYHTNGMYSGSESLDSTDTVTYNGNYISIKSTHCLSMKTSQMIARPNFEIRVPGHYRIYGRMYDTDKWTRIHDQPVNTPEVDSIVDMPVGGPCYYQHALVVNRLRGSFYLINFAEWRITGVIIDWKVACFKNNPSEYVIDQVDSGSPSEAPLLIDPAADNHIHAMYTWEEALTTAEMKIVTAGLRKELGGVPLSAGSAIEPIHNLRAYYFRLLLAIRPPQSINIFADLQGTNWIPDRMGNGFNAYVTSGTVSKVTTPGGADSGATNPLTTLVGTTNTKILWPPNSLPVLMTICSVTRYMPGSSQRILDAYGSPSQSENWIHGHTGNRRGLAFYGWYYTEWVTFGIKYDWLVMCGSTSTDWPGNIVIDQLDRGSEENNNGNEHEMSRLNINYLHSQRSDFNVHSVYIWDVELSSKQMHLITRALRAQIGGTPDGTDQVPVVPMEVTPAAYCAQCPTGFSMRSDTDSCGQCPVNTYGIECINCPAGTSSPVGSDEISECICALGHTAGSDGVECTACVEGTYKATTGSGSCTACPGGANSPVGSIDEDACGCSEGYFMKD